MGIEPKLKDLEVVIPITMTIKMIMTIVNCDDDDDKGFPLL